MKQQSRPLKDIYCIQAHYKEPLEVAARTYGVTVEEFEEMLIVGKREWEESLAEDRRAAARINMKNIRNSALPAQMEALMHARGTMTFKEFSEITKIQETRLQRIIRGHYPVYAFELTAITHYTGFDFTPYQAAMFNEAMGSTLTKRG